MVEKSKIEEWFQDHREEYLRDLAALVAIPSVKGEPAPDAPFGIEPRRALDAALALAEGYGFQTSTDDYYVGLVDYGDGPACLDVLAHLDVVPEGEGWTVTTPYEMKRQDGWLYGRGTADDKGPALAALYAMRCLKELGVTLKGRCRLILGTDEECGSGDIAHYYAHNPEAPMSFSPDAEYPLINVEKGRYAGCASVSAQEPCAVVSLQAGIAPNVVPGKARCVLQGLSEELVTAQAEAVSRATGTAITVNRAADGLHLLAEGGQAHASTPELGNNALTALIQLLCALPLGDGVMPGALRTLNTLFPHGDTVGGAAGIAGQDETGALTLCLSMLTLENGALKAQWDARVPASETEAQVRHLEEQLRAAGCAIDSIWIEPHAVSPDARVPASETEAQVRRLEEQLRAAGFAIDSSWTEPHAVSPDAPLVQTLLRCYEAYTGKQGECIAIGGGTYVHHLKNGVAFGCSFPGTDNRMHGADERAVEDDLILSGAIFAAAIAALCG